MTGASREMLFLRMPPAGWRALPGGPPRLARGRALGVDGIQCDVGEWRLTCFWVGLGKRVRTPGPGLLERLRDGSIGDLLDIGCAGALDPSLRRGDLILSSADVPFDTGRPLEVSRRLEAAGTARELARLRGVAFRVAPILTHERPILAREDRLRLYEETRCAVVQMEHVWFLRLLQRLLPESVFRALRVTHLALVTDTVPAGRQGWRRARSGWDAFRGYALPGRQGIVSLRREFLRQWLVRDTGGQAG